MDILPEDRRRTVSCHTYDLFSDIDQSYKFKNGGFGVLWLDFSRGSKQKWTVAEKMKTTLKRLESDLWNFIFIKRHNDGRLLYAENIENCGKVQYIKWPLGEN